MRKQLDLTPHLLFIMSIIDPGIVYFSIMYVHLIRLEVSLPSLPPFSITEWNIVSARNGAFLASSLVLVPIDKSCIVNLVPSS